MKERTFVPTCFTSLGCAWFVTQNHPDASDANEGTENSPFKTITRAAELMGKYDEVVIGEGIYREEVPLRVNGHHYMPEWLPVFRARQGEKVFLKGSDILDCSWKQLDDGSFITRLPEKLLHPNAYNPFALGLGRIFVDDEENLTDWRLSEDGESIVVDFNPEGKTIEITTRKRCIRPTFEGVVFIRVLGIRVEHAAEPGPFCFGRGESFRETATSGIKVRKTVNIPAATSRAPRLFMGKFDYLNKEENQLKAIIYDETIPDENTYVYDAVSDDHGETWRRVSDNRLLTSSFSEDLFLDEDNGSLIKTRMDFLPGADPRDGCGGNNSGKYQGVWEYSDDEGKTWSEAQSLGLNLVPFRILKLATGEYIFPCAETHHENGGFHQEIHVFRSAAVKRAADIKWEKVATLSVSPDESAAGLAEPHVTFFPNGRLVMLLRMGAILPAQGRNGVPSVKFYSVSDDQGTNWTKPDPLLYEDGEMIYSPRSYQDIIRSRKNGRVYAIFNVCDQPTTGCDPRDRLQIMEIDQETLRVKCETVSMVEERHPECHPLIRYSNWISIDSRETLNPVLFMRASMSEFCPVRYGYDMNSYRYEISLPE